MNNYVVTFVEQLLLSISLYFAVFDFAEEFRIVKFLHFSCKLKIELSIFSRTFKVFS